MYNYRRCVFCFFISMGWMSASLISMNENKCSGVEFFEAAKENFVGKFRCLEEQYYSKNKKLIDINMIDQFGNSLIMCALLKKSHQIIDYLMPRYINDINYSLVNNQKESLFDIAYNMDINPYSCFTKKDILIQFSTALKNNNTQLIEYLVKKYDECFNTIKNELKPLPDVVYSLYNNNNYREIPKKLLEANDKIIYVTDDKKCNIMHIAIECNNIEFLNLLFKSQCFDSLINSQNKYGLTPLHYAVSDNKTKIVKKILSSKNVVVDVPDKLGRTPLMIAIQNGNKKIIKWLIFMGADIFYKDTNDTPAIDYSFDEDFKKFIEEKYIQYNLSNII